MAAISYQGEPAKIEELTISPMRTRIQNCCMASLEEARLAIRAGADALGLVGAMSSGLGVIDDGTIAAIAAGDPRGG